MKCPCIECPERGCGEKHDTCEQFAEYKEWKRSIRAKKNLDAEYSAFKRYAFNNTLRQSEKKRFGNKGML